MRLLIQDVHVPRLHPDRRCLRKELPSALPRVKQLDELIMRFLEDLKVDSKPPAACHLGSPTWKRGSSEVGSGTSSVWRWSARRSMRKGPGRGPSYAAGASRGLAQRKAGALGPGF